MIDYNIMRLKLSTNYNKKWLDKSKNFDPKRSYANGNGITHWGRLYREEILSADHKKRLSHLEVNVAVNKTETLVTISNSLRKWMGSKVSAGRDLTYDQLRSCLEQIAESLNIPIEELLLARLTKLEWGATLKFKEDFSGFMGCIYQHKTLKDRCQWVSTVEFQGEHHSTIFYDKLQELKDKSKISKRTADKIKESWYYLRYEIKIHKALTYDFTAKHMSNFQDIFMNWDIIVKWWEDELLNITFVDTMSPEIYRYLKDVGESEFKEYICYQGIKSIGMQNIKNLIERRYPATKRGRGHGYILGINDKFRKLDKRSYKVIFKEAVKLKAEEMRIVKSQKPE